MPSKRGGAAIGEQSIFFFLLLRPQDMEIVPDFVNRDFADGQTT